MYEMFLFPLVDHFKKYMADDLDWLVTSCLQKEGRVHGREHKTKMGGEKGKGKIKETEKQNKERNKGKDDCRENRLGRENVPRKKIYIYSWQLTENKWFHGFRLFPRTASNCLVPSRNCAFKNKKKLFSFSMATRRAISRQPYIHD